LAWLEARDKTAQINSSSNPEGCRYIAAQLLRRDLGSEIADFGRSNLVAERVNVHAKLEVVHAFIL
jgi:hypothetical protein